MTADEERQPVKPVIREITKIQLFRKTARGKNAKIGTEKSAEYGVDHVPVEVLQPEETGTARVANVLTEAARRQRHGRPLVRPLVAVRHAPSGRKGHIKHRDQVGFQIYTLVTIWSNES